MLRGSVPRLFTSAASDRQKSTTPDATTATTTSTESPKDDQESAEPKEPKDTSRSKKSKPEVEFEAAMDKLRQIPPHQHAAEFDNIWTTYHKIPHPSQAAYMTQFLEYVTKHRTKSQLLAFALLRDKHRTLVHAWHYLAEIQREDMALDWKAFEAVFTIDRLASSIVSFVGSIKNPAVVPTWPAESQQGLLNRMIYPLICRYIEFYSEKQSLQLVVPFEDEFLYKEFLHVCIEKKKKLVADSLYRKYRQLPDIKLSGHVMERMLHHVYWPEDGAGMELAAKDIYARFGRLQGGQHRRLMMYYARSGDSVSVTRQWKQYEEQMKKDFGERWQPKPEEFSPLLHVHAVRGELSQIRRVFTTIQEKYGPELNTNCWNILLNAHAKSQEYEGAIRVFNAMRETVDLDRYTYGTMMGMTGSRGDIEFTLDMYRMAKDQGIDHDTAIIDSVVEVYCQNDRFADAEKICEIATASGNYEPTTLTTLWNSVLHHRAQLRDLVSINRILNTMTKNGIPYNGQTYEALLRGLALCRQADHAYFIIKEAARTESFRPETVHYALLMAAYIRTDRPQIALGMSNLLRMHGMPATGPILIRTLQALGSWTMAIREQHGNVAARRDFLVQALRDFRAAVERAGQRRKPSKRISGDTPAWISKYSVRTGPDQTLLTVTAQARLLCFIFAQFRELATVQDIMDMWKDSSPQASSMETPPLMLRSTLMLAAFNNSHFDEVETLWAAVFEDVKQQSQVSQPGVAPRTKALPSMRYVLNDALRTMMRTCTVKQDPDKLKVTVSSYIEAGFRLDSKNLNYYVQNLATLKQWREAFVTCEEFLMPHWAGWNQVRARLPGVPRNTPTELRRIRSSPRSPRPVSFTLIVLSKAYMELEQMAVWSTEAERLLQYISEKCPLCIAAIRSQIRANTLSMKEQIKSGQQVPKKAFGSPGHLGRLAREKAGWVMDEFYANVEKELQEDEEEEEGDEGAEEEEQDPEAVPEEDSEEDTTSGQWYDVGLQRGQVQNAGTDEWYDVDALDEENWTPMRVGQKSKSSGKKDKKRNVDDERLYDSDGRLVQGFVIKDETNQKASF